MDKRIPIEERIKSIKNLYDTLDQLGEYIPEGAVKEIKKAIFNDEKLNDLMENFDKIRAPRILVIGRTGFGKSSLINAIVGEYVAKISDTVTCTAKTEKYTMITNAGASMEILDTRGISESMQLDDAITAEDQIYNDVIQFNPDITLFVLNCLSRDGINEDAKFVKNICKTYKDEYGVELPVIAVLNKSDGVAPSREFPFSKEKKENIEEIKNNVKHILDNEKLKICDIVAVSSTIDWIDDNGIEYRVAHKINNLTEGQRRQLKISFDGRVNIKSLKRMIEKNIEDPKSRDGLKLVFSYEKIMKKICNNIINTFAVLGGGLVVNPMPVPDFVVLLSLETTMVATIMTVSGQEFSIEAAKKFIASLVGTTGAGLAFKEIAKLGLKFVPGGVLVNASVASTGIKLIGTAAEEYFVMGKDLASVKRNLEKNSNIKNKEKKVVDAANGFIKDVNKHAKTARKNIKVFADDVGKKGGKLLVDTKKSINSFAQDIQKRDKKKNAKKKK